MTPVVSRVHHVGIVVADFEAVVGFLTSALGLTVVERVEREDLSAVFLECDGTRIEVIDVHDPNARARRLGGRSVVIEHVAFGVEDLDATISRLEALGVRMRSRPYEVLNARTVFSDPATTCMILLQFIQAAGGAR